MIKTKKQMFLIIASFVLVILLGTATYAFFNYTRTGGPNTIKTGRIAFNSTQGNVIYLTNVFPVDVTNAIQKARALNTKYRELEVPVNDIDLKDYIILGGSGIIVDAEDWMETKEITINL